MIAIEEVAGLGSFQTDVIALNVQIPGVVASARGDSWEDMYDSLLRRGVGSSTALKYIEGSGKLTPSDLAKLLDAVHTSTDRTGSDMFGGGGKRFPDSRDGFRIEERDEALVKNVLVTLLRNEVVDPVQDAKDAAAAKKKATTIPGLDMTVAEATALGWRVVNGTWIAPTVSTGGGTGGSAAVEEEPAAGVSTTTIVLAGLAGLAVIGGVLFLTRPVAPVSGLRRRKDRR